MPRALDLYYDETQQPSLGAPVEAISDDLSTAMQDAWRYGQQRRVEHHQEKYLDSVIEEVRSATGESFPNPMNLSAQGGYGRPTSDRQQALLRLQARIEQLRKEKPQLKLSDATPEAVQQGGLALDREGYRNEMEARQRRITSASQWGAFFGGTAANMADPINVAVTLLTLPIAGPSGILGAAAFQGAVAGATQAGMELRDFSHIRQYDPEYTYMESLKEIGAATVGGAALGGITAGIVKGAPFVARGAKKAAQALTRAQKDAENIVERRVLFDHPPPGAPDGPGGANEHRVNMEIAERQFEAGEAVDVPYKPRAAEPVRTAEPSYPKPKTEEELAVLEPPVRNAETAYARAATEGIVPDVERLSVEGMASKDIAERVVPKLSQEERIGLVEATRQKLGIPDKDTPEFEAWRQAKAIPQAYGPEFQRLAAAAVSKEAQKLTGALREAAPAVARLKQAVSEGRVEPHYDLTRDLLHAARTVTKAVEEGKAPQEAIDASTLSPIGRAIAESFLDDTGLRLKPRPSIRKMVKDYVRAAEQPQKVLRETLENAGEAIVNPLQKANAADLFGAVEQASDPAALDKLADSPEFREQVIREAEVAIARGGEDSRRIAMGVNEKGEPIYRDAKAVFAELDREMAAAHNLKSCVNGESEQQAQKETGSLVGQAVAALKAERKVSIDEAGNSVTISVSGTPTPEGRVTLGDLVRAANSKRAPVKDAGGNIIGDKEA
jgi:hypothetical protein